MKQAPASDPNSLFAAANDALRGGRYGESLARLDQLERLVGHNPAVFHLRALALRGAGREDEALAAFEAALGLQPAPGDPYLLANTANLLEKMGQGSRALDLLAAASRIAPQVGELHEARLAAVRRITGDEAARRGWNELLAANPDAGELHHYHALFLQDAMDYAGALAAIERALALRPGSANARQLKARLLLDLGRPDSNLFAQVCRSLPDDEAAAMGHASALSREGRLEDALAALDAAATRHPGWYEAIGARRAMLQQQRSFEAAEEWLQDLIAARPGDTTLQLMLVNQVWRHGGAAAGLETWRAVVPSADPPLTARIAQAELLSETGEFAAADAIYAAIRDDLGQMPPGVRMGEVRHLFRAGRIDDATGKAHAIAIQSGLQEAWTHVETGWRILGDPRWHWLTGEGELVQQHALDGFAGYGEALIEHLHDLHRPFRHHPLEQSPRGGTQTDGVLFGSGHPAIVALRRDVDANVRAYLASIPDLGPDHPLHAACGRNFRYTGSWSIRLASQGFHNPHFHNEGAVSSACHIALPAAVSAANSNARPGWLELGRPIASLGTGLDAWHAVQPRAGYQVLFPSFFWHGTRPFADGERLSVALDLVPLLP